MVAPQDIPVGIDGEAAVLSSPVHFRIRPAVLRVRIAAHHPGASPSAIEPVGAMAALRALVRHRRRARPAPVASPGSGTGRLAVGGAAEPLTTLPARRRERRCDDRQRRGDRRRPPVGAVRRPPCRDGAALPTAVPGARSRAIPEDVVPVLAEVERATAAGHWAFGFLGYEAAAGLDPALAGAAARPGRSSPGLVRALRAAHRGPARRGRGPPHPRRWTGGRTGPTRTTARAVGRVREHIAAGDTYQVNLTDRLRATSPETPRSSTPAWPRPSAARTARTWTSAGTSIASASPELFFEWDGDRAADPPDEGHRCPRPHHGRRRPAAGRAAAGQPQGAGREPDDRRPAAQRPLARRPGGQRRRPRAVPLERYRRCGS